MKQRDCAECDGVVHRRLPWFVSTQHNKRHQEEVEIRVCSGIVGDVLENSIFPGDQIVKILH
jgi:hypothetical protein